MPPDPLYAFFNAAWQAVPEYKIDEARLALRYGGKLVLDRENPKDRKCLALLFTYDPVGKTHGTVSWRLSEGATIRLDLDMRISRNVRLLAFTPIHRVENTRNSLRQGRLVALEGQTPTFAMRLAL